MNVFVAALSLVPLPPLPAGACCSRWPRDPGWQSARYRLVEQNIGRGRPAGAAADPARRPAGAAPDRPRHAAGPALAPAARGADGGAGRSEREGGCAGAAAAPSVSTTVHLDNFEGPVRPAARADREAPAIDCDRSWPLSKVTRPTSSPTSAASGACLGPRAGHRVPARRRPAAGHEGRPGCCPRPRSRTEEDLALLEARDHAVRAPAAVPRLQAGRLRISRRWWRRRPVVTHAWCMLEPRFADLLPEVLLGLGPAEFAALAARDRPSAAGRGRGRPRARRHGQRARADRAGAATPAAARAARRSGR
jgi:hypothetical protein